MVKESCNGDGFVLSHPDQASPWLSTTWGSRVEITDFETLDDGLLGITVQAQQLVNLTDFYRQPDGLLKARTDIIEHWPQQRPAPSRRHWPSNLSTFLINIKNSPSYTLGLTCKTLAGFVAGGLNYCRSICNVNNSLLSLSPFNLRKNTLKP
jgi:hypothetical protein